MLTIGSLFTGYGGLDLAVQAVIGGTVSWHSDTDPGSSRLLAHHYPDVPNLGDVNAIDWDEVQPVDILTAGYPCQPFSAAGLHKGSSDARYLWPAVARALSHLGPRLVVLENVSRHLNRGFSDVLASLSTLGYDARWATLRASSVGAPHRRDRLFAVANPSPDAGHGGVPNGPRSSWGEGWERASEWVVTRADPPLAPDTEDVGYERPGPARGRRVGSANRGHSATDAHSERLQGEHGDPATARPAQPTGCGGGGEPDWGAYGPAIERWERVLGRVAPAPTAPNRNGLGRLSPPFVEWMMGLPAGHVTNVPDLSRGQQLKLLGNGVVPQQAEAALRRLGEVMPPCPRT